MNQQSARQIWRRIVTVTATCGVTLFALCLYAYAQDAATLKQTALQVTSLDVPKSQRVLDLLDWVHHNSPSARNEEYFLWKRLRATPLQTAVSGGDCADKSRLLVSLLSHVGVSASMAMCFDGDTNRPTHTVLNADIEHSEKMIVDPAFNIYFPRPGGDGYYGLLDLRREPTRLLQRLVEVGGPKVWPRNAAYGYRLSTGKYDRASTVNWNRNQLFRLTHTVLFWLIGDKVYELSRPWFLEEPRLLFATIGLGTCIVSVLLLGLPRAISVRRRAAHVAPNRAGFSTSPA